MKSILERLDHGAAEHPHKLLYSFLNVRGEATESFSYQAFLERTNVIAAHLAGEQRCKPGDRLLLCFPPGLETLCAFFAVVRAGLIPVPVYPPNARGFEPALHKMIHIAKDCEASGVLTSRTFYGSLKARLAKTGPSAAALDKDYVANLKWIVTEDLRQSPGSAIATKRAHDILFLQYTSGSTSNPKGVIVSHANVLHNCALVVDHAAPVVVSWLPQYHDMGLIGGYLYPALTGGTTYGFSPSTFIQRPALWFETITKYEASITSAPNFAFEYCLRPGRIPEASLANADLSSLRLLMTAAEPVKAATYLRFLHTFQPNGLAPERFCAAYGLAENTLAVSTRGTNVLSVSNRALSKRRVRVTRAVSEIAGATRVVSCGKPLGDIVVKIVEPESRAALPDGSIGEIWIDGPSKCLGYWNKHELSQSSFHAQLLGEKPHGDGYLRTGDLGFVHQDELYVCGRLKDMIIVRGQNYYPQDIENVVEESSDLVRRTCVAAVEIDRGQGPEVAVIAEVRSANAHPDPRDVVTAIREHLGVETAVVAFVAPKEIPKTSSGKIMRQRTKELWLDRKFNVLCELSHDGVPCTQVPSSATTGRFDELRVRYRLRGDESQSLAELGVDSLDLVLLSHEIAEILKDNGADGLADQVDIGLIQDLKVSELFRLAELFEQSPETAVLHLRSSLGGLREQHRRREHDLMCADKKLIFEPRYARGALSDGEGGGVLLTGGTGFFGPFLLKSLIEQTNERIYVLTRAADPDRAAERLRQALASTGPLAAPLDATLGRRVVPICGDLGSPNLGLTEETWRRLASGVHTIYHNGANVNYVFSYEALRAGNILGTNEVLRLAFEGAPKTVNYMSTTFIFGWSIKPTLFEADSNEGMEGLDFGYSQSKWTAEHVVRDAARRGLQTRIFRPSLVSPSLAGGGSDPDIATRLLAFMIHHGIGVDTLNQVSFVPADIVANNIVAICREPSTVNGTYHVTRDEYANMMDITSMMTELTGRRFKLFKLREFVPEVIRRSTKDDLVFPLLDFLLGSVDRIAAMEFKRYDSSEYQRARNACRGCLQDPTLEDTVRGILRFLERKGIARLRETRTSAPVGSNRAVLQAAAG